MVVIFPGEYARSSKKTARGFELPDSDMTLQQKQTCRNPQESAVTRPAIPNAREYHIRPIKWLFRTDEILFVYIWFTSSFSYSPTLSMGCMDYSAKSPVCQPEIFKLSTFLQFLLAVIAFRFFLVYNGDKPKNWRISP